MPRPTRRMLSSATRMASSVLSPISRGYREAGIRGAIGSAKKPLMYRWWNTWCRNLYGKQKTGWFG
jgi:hypothetical protein